MDVLLLDDGSDESDGGVYGLQVSLLDDLGALPVEVTIDAPADASNYGESYTTTDPAGSEEILYFPLVVGVYGSCRTVTATMALDDGSRHEAEIRIGTGCPDGP